MRAEQDGYSIRVVSLKGTLEQVGWVRWREI
jgi:hypothetical protein